MGTKANRVYTIAELVRLQLPLSLARLSSIRREQFADAGDFAVTGNIANLTLQMRAHGLTCHVLSAEALALCKETEVFNEPLQCPELLKKPGIIQVQDIRTQTLFHKCINIGWYHNIDQFGRKSFRLLVGNNTLNGESDMEITEWAPCWDGRSIRDKDYLNYLGKDYQQNFSTADLDRVIAHCRDAQTIMLTVALILEAERTPIYEKYSREGDPVVVPSDTPGQPPRQRLWRIKYFYATKPEVKRVYDEGHSEKPPREGLSLEERPVRAHLRSQRFGKGLSQVKTKYIAAYLGCRWIDPTKATKVIVK